MTTKTLEALNISAVVMFTGTDEEIKAAEAKENARAQEVEQIIFSGDFKALEYFNYNNQRRILHRSTRPGVMFQLSYIDSDGVPAMHENFIKSSENHVNECIEDKSKLLRHFINASNSDNITLNIYSKEDLTA